MTDIVKNMRVQRASWTFCVAMTLACTGGCTNKEPEAAKETAEAAAEAAPTELDLWAGVPELVAEPDDTGQPLTPRPKPLSPPTVQETIEAPFPIDGVDDVEVPAPEVAGPLEVERRGPTGDQGLVDAIRVSFNQPMVPLADLETLDSAPALLEIEPAIVGTTQWLGTRTLAFKPEAGRLPYSTDYEVTVRAGVTSTWGEKLASDVDWTFSTPTLALTSATPYDGSADNELEPTIALTFNQPINRTALLAAIKLAGRGDSVALKLAPAAASTTTPATEEAKWKADRRIELVPERALRTNTTYTLRIPAGVYGEGPRASKAISTSFSTYRPLTLEKAKCWDTCWANEGISLQATSALQDPDIASKVHVSPEPPGFAVHANWRSIQLTGDFEGRTAYRVTVDAGLRDVHGQTLARDFKTTVTLGPPYPQVGWPSAMGNPVVIERNASKEVELSVGGLSHLDIEARTLPLGDVPDFLDAYPYSNEREWPRGLAAATFSTRLNTKGSMRRTERHALDLAPILGADTGHLWFLARSNPITTHGWTQRYAVHRLVEVTDLGVAAAIDRDSGIAMVTRLSTGEPVAGAKLRLVNGNDRTERWSGTTDENGLAQMDVRVSDGSLRLTASLGDDTALLRVDRNDLRGRWRYSGGANDNQARAFFFADRKPHKPGDTVHLAGILRQEMRGPKGGVELWRRDFRATYTVTNPRGVEVAKGEVQVGPLGTFSFDIPTEEDHGTGDFGVQMTVSNLLGSDQQFYHSFPVETYRAPEFTVAVSRPDSKPLVFGDTLVAEIRGEYLHGAPLIGGAVSHTLRRSDTGFSPPGSLNEGFTFGIANNSGYGGYWGHRGGFGWSPPVPSPVIAQGEATLDARGLVTIEHALSAVEPPPKGSTAPPAAPKKAEGDAPPIAATFTLDATVVDENRQAIAGSGSFVVHAARMYVGLRSERTVMREGERATLEAVAVDLEGERISARPIELSLLRRETTRTAVEKDGRWTHETKTEEHETGRCTLTSGPVPAKCELDVGKPGTYVVRGESEDSEGHATRSELRVFVYGKDAVVWENTERRVDLVPDKREYAPGDTATLLVRSPFDTARGVVVVEREGIAAQYPVVIEGGAATVEVPIDESMLPAVTASALLTRGRVEVPGAPAGQDLGMPAAATGQVRLPISVDSKKIEVELTPSRKELSPGETITLDLKTTSTDGKALPAAVAVMVVDEGVLSLMGHTTPDPLSFFHHERAGDVWLYALQAAVLARDPASIATPAAPTGGAPGEPEEDSVQSVGLGAVGGIGYGSGSGALREQAAPTSRAAPAAPSPDIAEKKMDKSRRKRAKGKTGAVRTVATEGLRLDVADAMAQPVSLREVFATTAFYKAEVLTDAEGNASVEIEMPENLTTFRVMAVAVDTNTADRFGSGDTTVRVRKPLMVRPSLPRFANYGDTFEASVMVDNQTGADQAILVGTRGLNVVLPGDAQKMIDIPAGESREVRFDMETKEVGTMRLQFAAMSNGGRDATELSIPVHYPATAEAFADYGMIDSATELTVAPPNEALPAFGGLEVSMSSTALSGLEDAVDYLVTYPYECAEQTASRILPIFALSDVLDDFPIAGLSDRIYRDRLAAQGLERLRGKQSHDGGFGYWKADESWPYLTNWVTFAMLEGKRAGFKVDDAVLNRALSYVENYVAHGHRTRWGLYYDWTSRAMGLWILSGEKRGAALFDRVWAHRKEMPLYARALMMTAAHRYGRKSARDEVLDELRDAAVESPKAVHFAESRTEAEADGLRVLMHSSVQTDAIAMMALIEVEPTDSMIPKIMAGIMASRDPMNSGRWNTTHANAWALVAADRYYESVEADEPDFTARIWLDKTLSGAHKFEGRSMATVEQRLPMQDLQGAEQRALIMGKEGPGKLYYRVGLRYAPKDLEVPARDQGFVVQRHYEAIPEGNDPIDKTAVQRVEDGSWQVKAGTNVKVTLTVVAADRANYVVIDDALPAGFEGQNARFATSVAARDESTRTASPSRWWWPWWSFDHTDLRDDRMLLFADQMPAGVYTYSYTARATTLGTFVLPPVKAEAMYEPERFGHSASSVVRVVE